MQDAPANSCGDKCAGESFQDLLLLLQWLPLQASKILHCDMRRHCAIQDMFSRTHVLHVLQYIIITGIVATPPPPPPPPPHAQASGAKINMLSLIVMHKHPELMLVHNILAVSLQSNQSNVILLQMR